MIIIFSLALIAYSYYFIDSIKDLQKRRFNDSKRRGKQYIYLLLVVYFWILLMYFFQQ